MNWREMFQKSREIPENEEGHPDFQWLDLVLFPLAYSGDCYFLSYKLSNNSSGLYFKIADGVVQPICQQFT